MVMDFVFMLSALVMRMLSTNLEASLVQLIDVHNVSKGAPQSEPQFSSL